MFAKLKKKIQDEGSGSPGGGASSDAEFKSPKLPSPAPGIASPVKLDFPGVMSPPRREPPMKDFETMSMSSELSDVKDTASKEDLVKKIFKKNDQIKKLESKITELAAMIKERNRNIEKLEKSIEKQKQENSNQLEELKSKQEAQRAKYIQEDTEQLKITLKTLEEEKQELQKKVHEANEYKKKYLKNEEEKEEFTGLTTQEMAKVKHMLLNTQDDLQQCQKELKEKAVRLVSSEKQGKDLENEVQSLSEQIKQLTSRSEETDKENTKNKATIDQLKGVQTELVNKTKELRSTRESLDKLQHSLDVLQKNSDMHQIKMTKLVEEKDEHISHLRERVQTLEKRLEDSDLSGDERLSALEKERTALEVKLSEAREHLNQIKSTWSDKISHLEAQIANLNRKIADDNEELLNSRKEIEDVKDHCQAKVDDLESRLEKSQMQSKKQLDIIASKDLEFQSLKKEHSSEMLREKLHWTSLETELREKMTDLHKDIDSLQRTREHEKITTQQKISKLESNQEEWLEKEIDTEKQITGLEDTVQELKCKLQKKDRQIDEGGVKDEIIKKLKNKIKEEEKNVDAHNSKIVQLEKEAENVYKEYHSCVDEKDSLLLRNAQLSQEYESFKRKVKDQQGDLETELQQKNHSIAGIEQVLEDMQQEAEQYKQKVHELESQQMVAITEIESEEIKKLQKEVQALEDQLLDRNKTVKKLQQRMADLKKTLQRELNVQALPNDEINEYNQKDPSRTMNGQHNYSNSLHKDFIPNSVTTYQNSEPLTDSETIGSLPVTSNTTVNVGHRKFYEGASDFSASDLENIALSMANSNKQNSNNSKSKNSRMYAGVQYDRDINFEYLKHVIMKFILSRESESVHLVKAVGVLLDLSLDEQKLMQETLEYKMSWFGTKPSLGHGQYSKFIPPAL